MMIFSTTRIGNVEIVLYLVIFGWVPSRFRGVSLLLTTLWRDVADGLELTGIDRTSIKVIKTFALFEKQNNCTIVAAILNMTQRVYESSNSHADALRFKTQYAG